MNKEIAGNCPECGSIKFNLMRKSGNYECFICGYTVSPSKWDWVKKNGLKLEDGRYVLLDESDLKKLKEKGKIRYCCPERHEGITIVYIKSKKE